MSNVAKNKTGKRATQRPKRMRSRTRRPSPPSVGGPEVEVILRQLNEDALAAIGLDRTAAKKAALPDVAFHFGLVPYGYEMHIFIDGTLVHIADRDFSGDDHSLDTLKTSLIQAISLAVKDWRNQL